MEVVKGIFASVRLDWELFLRRDGRIQTAVSWLVSAVSDAVLPCVDAWWLGGRMLVWVFRRIPLLRFFSSPPGYPQQLLEKQWHRFPCFRERAELLSLVECPPFWVAVFPCPQAV